MSVDHFLLIRLSAVGDVVNTLPMLTLLRRARPGATIGFLVEDRARDLLIDHPLVDHVHVFPRRRWREMLKSPTGWKRLGAELAAHRSEIRQVGYDTAIDVQGNLKGGVYSLLSGASRRIGFAAGYDREFNHLVSTDQVEPPIDRPHRVDKFASLLTPLGIEDSTREWVFPRSEAAESTISRFLAEHAIDPGESVMIHPGTSGHGVAKRWSEASFAELARRIATELDRPVIFTWGPGEESLVRSMASPSHRVFVGPPTGSLLELLALLSKARFLVSADTGPMHLAAAAGVTCVALFGPKDPAIYAPYGPGHVVLYRPQGVLGISVDEVLSAITTKLAA